MLRLLPYTSVGHRSQQMHAGARPVVVPQPQAQPLFAASKIKYSVFWIALFAFGSVFVAKQAGCYDHTVKSHGVDVPKDMVPAWDTLQAWSGKDTLILKHAKKWMPIVSSDVFKLAQQSIAANEGTAYNPNDPSILGIINAGEGYAKKPSRIWFNRLLKKAGAVNAKGKYKDIATLPKTTQDALALAVAAIIVEDGYWKRDADRDGKDDPAAVQQVHGELAFNGGTGRARAVVNQAKERLPQYNNDMVTAMVVEYLTMAYSRADSMNYWDNYYTARLDRYARVLGIQGKQVTVAKGKGSTTGQDTLTVNGIKYPFHKKVDKPKAAAKNTKKIVKKPAKAKGKLKVTNSKTNGSKPKSRPATKSTPAKKLAKKH